MGKTADEMIRFIREDLLPHHIGNVQTLRDKELNLGYPILLTVMSSIEIVAVFCYDDNKMHPVDKYFSTFMSSVNPLYGVVLKNWKSAYRKKTASSSNTGTLLRDAMRNRIAHSGGSLLIIDAQKHTEAKHLTKIVNSDYTSLYIHAYKLHEDFVCSLDFLYEHLSSDTEFCSAFEKRIDSEREMMSKQIAILTNVLSKCKFPLWEK